MTSKIPSEFQKKIFNEILKQGQLFSGKVLCDLHSVASNETPSLKGFKQRTGRYTGGWATREIYHLRKEDNVCPTCGESLDLHTGEGCPEIIDAKFVEESLPQLPPGEEKNGKE
jgi:hypothetical protein